MKRGGREETKIHGSLHPQKICGYFPTMCGTTYHCTSCVQVYLLVLALLLIFFYINVCILLLQIVYNVFFILISVSLFQISCM